MTYCLFAGRHELPQNIGAICTDFDFSTMQTVQSDLWEQSLQDIIDGKNVEILVTGITPALTEYLSAVLSIRNAANNYGIDLLGTLSLLHFNNATKEYVPQKFLHHD